MLKLLDETYEVLNHANGEVALEQALNFLASAPKEPDSFLLMAEIAQENSQSEQALAWINKGLSFHPHHVGLLTKKASLLMDDFEDVDEAFAILSHLIDSFQEITPQNALKQIGHTLVLDVFLLFIDCLRLKGHYQQAYDASLIAHDLAPNDENAVLALATAEFELGHYDESLKRVDHMLQKHDLADLLRLKAYVLCAQGDFLQADEAFLDSSKMIQSRYHRPVRLTQEAFVQAFEQSIMAMPREIRELIETCAVEICDIVPLERIQMSKGSLSPQACITIDAVTNNDGKKVNVISLFQKNIENLAMRKEEIKDIIASALLHELGKTLGVMAV